MVAMGSGRWALALVMGIGLSCGHEAPRQHPYVPMRVAPPPSATAERAPAAPAPLSAPVPTTPPAAPGPPVAPDPDPEAETEAQAEARRAYATELDRTWALERGYEGEEVEAQSVVGVDNVLVFRSSLRCSRQFVYRAEAELRAELQGLGFDVLACCLLHRDKCYGIQVGGGEVRER